MPAVILATTPVPPDQSVRATETAQDEGRGLTIGGGIGWPEIAAIDVRVRPEPRVGLGAWFAVSVPLPLIYATPLGYVRYYFEGGRHSPFLQFGAGSRINGLFGRDALTASPLIMASLGYEWRLSGGITGSADIGGVFDFSLTGTSPNLRLGLRLGYSTF